MAVTKLIPLAALLSLATAVTHPQFYQQLRPVASHSLPQTMIQLLQQRRQQRLVPEATNFKVPPPMKREIPTKPKFERITKASVNPTERKGKQETERTSRAVLPTGLGYTAPHGGGVGLGLDDSHGLGVHDVGLGKTSLGLDVSHGIQGLSGGHGIQSLSSGHGIQGLSGGHGFQSLSSGHGLSGGHGSSFSSSGLLHDDDVYSTSGGFSGDFHHSLKHQPHHHKPAKYDFGYAVHDKYGNDFGHRESRAGFDTKGAYYVQLPDGRRQTVNYFVNKGSGYVANVQYEGKAKFPVSPKHHSGYQGDNHIPLGVHLPRGKEVSPFGLDGAQYH